MDSRGYGEVWACANSEGLLKWHEPGSYDLLPFTLVPTVGSPAAPKDSREEELALLLAHCGTVDNGPEPHLGSTIDLDLVMTVLVNWLCWYESRRAGPPPCGLQH